MNEIVLISAAAAGGASDEFEREREGDLWRRRLARRESERGVNEHLEEGGKSQSGEFISVLAGGYTGRFITHRPRGTTRRGNM